MQQITPIELKNILDENVSINLIDVREEWEFEKCHVEGSRNINMNVIPENISEIDTNKKIIVICHHGVRSFQVAQYLESNGFKDVMNLDGGIDAWARIIDNSMPLY